MCKNNKKNYYVVYAKCGHVGRFNHIVKAFPIRAASPSEAALIAREKPRVKHNRKDAIVSVKEVTKKDYKKFLANFRADPFFRCKCIQDQRLYCPDIYNEIETDKEEPDESLRWGQRQEKRALRTRKERNARRDLRSQMVLV